MDKLRKKEVPTNVVQDWVAYNMVPGQYILLPTADPETTIVVYTELNLLHEGIEE